MCPKGTSQVSGTLVCATLVMTADKLPCSASETGRFLDRDGKCSTKCGTDEVVIITAEKELKCAIKCRDGEFREW